MLKSDRLGEEAKAISAAPPVEQLERAMDSPDYPASPLKLPRPGSRESKHEIGLTPRANRTSDSGKRNGGDLHRTKKQLPNAGDMGRPSSWASPANAPARK